MNQSQWQERTTLLLGKDAISKLNSSHVLVAGLGGVGSYAAELVCRAGVGRITVVDGDSIDHSNRNRQLPALSSTVGKRKVEVMAARLFDINPDAQITAIDQYMKDESMVKILDAKYDYVIDAIDTLSPKVFFIKLCLERGFKLVSSMGSGAKVDPSQIKIADIADSYKCSLARAVRKRLHRMGIKSGFKVVFSTEENLDNSVVSLDDDELPNKKSVVGAVSYMTCIFGAYCASAVIRDLSGN